MSNINEYFPQDLLDSMENHSADPIVVCDRILAGMALMAHDWALEIRKPILPENQS